MKLMYSFLFLFTTSLLACKKDNTSNQLNGKWIENNNVNFVRTLEFGADKSFKMSFNYSNSPNDRTTFHGSYLIEGDSLKVSILEKVGWAPRLYENATFKVTNNTLTLKYTTYPADAPVATTSTFSRAPK